MLAAFGDGALLWVNCKRVARAKIQVGDYSLTESYQLSENHMTIRIILPCSTVHGVLYGLYFLLSKTVREPYRRLQDVQSGAVVEGIHLISTASICGVLVIFYWTQRSVTNRLKANIVKVESVANAHFDMFKRQMDIAYREKKTWRKASVALVISKLAS
ncbi:hypothetical protein AAVH_36000 [Aphelenchoides avenae]|nr:hypothetical protein AAVH_36000 [Aphelenchus avenae]